MKLAVLCTTSTMATLVASLLFMTAQAAPTEDETPVSGPRAMLITTQLQEVQRGTVDGTDYLSIQISGQPVGPANCRGTTLRIDTSQTPGDVRQGEIETQALSAMLTSEPVMITVPMTRDQCLNGKPTFTNLHLLPPNL